MLHFFKNLSIKTKLTLVVMFTSTVLLILISAIVLVSEIYTARASLTHELQLLANTVSANSRKPLVLGNHAKIDSLLATLIYQDNIHAAYFFDGEGVPISQYLVQHDSKFILRALNNDFSSSHESFWIDSITENQIFTIDHISLFTPVFYQGERIGTLYLLSDLGRLHDHLGNVALAIVLSLLLMSYLSWLLAGWIQRPISVPLLKLTALTKQISQGNDYSFRAKKVSSDEIGVLVDGFNRMLEKVEQHQSRLADHQLHLEQTVADRTAELRTAVSSLKLAREQADDANQAKSHFLSRMTHELRTPLIGVLGMNELLTRTPLSKQQLELVDTVHKSGNQLLHLIGDVLDFSRIEAGKLELEVNEFDLQGLVRDVVALLIVQAQQKDLVLQCDLSADRSCWVCADETRIRQILMNLISNAIKFTATGSVVVGLNCVAHSDKVGTFILEVEDTGAGLSVVEQQQIFEVFYQVEGIGSAGGGAGLGLAIVKQLVDLMGGDLNLFSEQGQGSKFQVVLELSLVENVSQLKGDD